MRRKSRRTGQRFALRLEALESRLLPGDTLLGVAVVARQALASASCTPLAAVIPEEAEATAPADLWSEWGRAAPRTGGAGSKRAAQEEPSSLRIRADAPQDALLQAAEALQLAFPRAHAHGTVLPGSWPDRAQGPGWLPLAAMAGPMAAGSGGEHPDAGRAGSPREGAATSRGVRR